jgi:hypothetical protein
MSRPRNRLRASRTTTRSVAWRGGLLAATVGGRSATAWPAIADLGPFRAAAPTTHNVHLFVFDVDGVARWYRDNAGLTNVPIWVGRCASRLGAQQNADLCDRRVRLCGHRSHRRIDAHRSPPDGLFGHLHELEHRGRHRVRLLEQPLVGSHRIPPLRLRRCVFPIDVDASGTCARTDPPGHSDKREPQILTSHRRHGHGTWGELGRAVTMGSPHLIHRKGEWRVAPSPTARPNQDRPQAAFGVGAGSLTTDQ